MSASLDAAARNLTLAAAVALVAAAPWPAATADPGQAGGVMLAGALLFVLVAASSGWLARGRVSTGLVCFAGFVAWSAVGAAGGVAPFHGAQMLAVWVAGLAVCAGIALAADTPGRARGAGRGLVVAAAVLAGYGLLHWHLAPPASGDDSRLSSTFANADCFAAVLILALGLGMGLVAGGSPRERLAFSAATFVISLALLLTGSRAGWIGAAAAAVAFGLIAARRPGQRLVGRALAAPVLALLLLLGSGALSASGGRWLQLLDTRSTEGLSVRAMVLQGAPATFRRSPIWGAGPGNFAQAFLRDRPHGAFRGFINQAHIDPIQVAVETGAVGLALWLAALILALRSGMRAPPYAGALSAGTAAALVGIAAYGLMNFALPVPADFVWISATLGLAFAYGRIEPARSGRPTAPEPAGGGLLATVVLGAAALACAAFVGLLGGRALIADHWSALAQSRIAELRWEDGLDAVDHALAVQPGDEQLYSLRARIEERLGIFDGDRSREAAAMADMQHALALNPNGQGLRLQAAGLFEAAGDDAQAERLLLAARDACPSSMGPWAELARLYQRTNRLPQAAQCYWHVMGDFPEMSTALARVLVAAQATGAGGAATLDEWRRQSGADPAQLRKLGLQTAQFAESIARPLDAEPFYRILLQWDRSDTCAALGEARLQQARHQLPEAAATLSDALQNASPVNPSGCYEGAYLALGDIQIARGDRQGAIDRLLAYLKTSPWSSAAALKLADAYEGAGRIDAATDVLKDATQHAPATAALESRLADLYRKQGLTGLADEADRQAQRLSASANASDPNATRTP